MTKLSVWSWARRPGGDELVDALAVEREPPPPETRDLLSIEIEPDRDAELLRLAVGWRRQPGPDLRHGTDLHAAELDRRPTLRPFTDPVK